MPVFSEEGLENGCSKSNKDCLVIHGDTIIYRYGFVKVQFLACSVEEFFFSHKLHKLSQIWARAWSVYLTLQSV
jgi:hypothetical protein